MTKDEVLKLALEAMESVTVECNNFHHPKKDQNHHWAKCPPVARWDKAITAIKEALAQPEQEPVASIFISGIGEREFDDWGHDLPVGRNLLYTTSPQRTWVGLTDEEMYRYCPNWLSQSDFKAMMLHIEAKLKQKNGYAEEKNI